MTDPIRAAAAELIAAAHREQGRPAPRDPRLRALDRSLPAAERRRAYIEWAESLGGSHIHPGHAAHVHAGGVPGHSHEKETHR